MAVDDDDGAEDGGGGVRRVGLLVGQAGADAVDDADAVVSSVLTSDGGLVGKYKVEPPSKLLLFSIYFPPYRSPPRCLFLPRPPSSPC